MSVPAELVIFLERLQMQLSHTGHVFENEDHVHVSRRPWVTPLKELYFQPHDAEEQAENENIYHFNNLFAPYKEPVKYDMFKHNLHCLWTKMDNKCFILNNKK